MAESESGCAAVDTPAVELLEAEQSDLVEVSSESERSDSVAGLQVEEQSGSVAGSSESESADLEPE
jgi:hypothetical protein